jgi:branched-chain amino acid transport system permease protein
MNALCFALFACAFNLLIGYVGLLSFGHAAYFGFSSYITAYTLKAWHFPTEIGLIAGVLVATVMGALIGALAIRRQGIYFAMITLAMAQMVYFFSLQAPFTGGENGIQGVPHPPILGFIKMNDDLSMYFVVVAIFLIGFGIIYRAIHSPFGQVLKAIRENEPRARSLGYHVERYKLLAFTLSAALAGLAGSTKVLVQNAAALSDIQWQMSGEVVLMTLVGGMGTIFGPVVGAFIIVAMQNYLQVGEWVLVIQGVIFVVVVLAFRRGVVGELTPLLRRLFRSNRAPQAKPAE